MYAKESQEMFERVAGQGEGTLKKQRIIDLKNRIYDVIPKTKQDTEDTINKQDTIKKQAEDIIKLCDENKIDCKAYMTRWLRYNLTDIEFIYSEEIFEILSEENQFITEKSLQNQLNATNTKRVCEFADMAQQVSDNRELKIELSL